MAPGGLEEYKLGPQTRLDTLQWSWVTARKRGHCVSLLQRRCRCVNCVFFQVYGVVICVAEGCHSSRAVSSFSHCFVGQNIHAPCFCPTCTCALDFNSFESMFGAFGLGRSGIDGINGQVRGGLRPNVHITHHAIPRAWMYGTHVPRCSMCNYVPFFGGLSY